MIDEEKKVLIAEIYKLTPTAQDAIWKLFSKFNKKVSELEQLKYEISCMENQLNFPDEEWRNIEGYEGRYQVSNFGRIKSFTRGKGKIFKVKSSPNGYYLTHLTKNSQTKTFRVHRLVAQEFIPNPENKPFVNHKDGKKWNNLAENLEWVTQKENNIHAHKIGLSKPPTASQKAEFTEDDIRYIRENIKIGDKVFGQLAMARKFGVSPASIRQIITGKTYKYVI